MINMKSTFYFNDRLGRYGNEEGLYEYITVCAHASGSEHTGHYGMAWGNLMLVENFTDAKEMEQLIEKLEDALSDCRDNAAGVYKGWLSLLKGEQYMLRSYLDISIQFYAGQLDEAKTLLHDAREMQTHLHRDEFLTALDLGWRWMSSKLVTSDYSYMLLIRPEEDLSVYTNKVLGVSIITDQVKPISFLFS